MSFKTKNRITSWLYQEDGIAATEFALVFPILFILLLGMVDLGNGLLTNKKVITASQMAADLITRQLVADDADIADAVLAAQLAMQPLNIASFGIDIASIRFEGDNADPTVIWRETVNMPPNGSIEALSDGLGVENEGLIAVTVQYTYKPHFTNVFLNDIDMREVSYMRGRRNSFVARE